MSPKPYRFIQTRDGEYEVRDRETDELLGTVARHRAIDPRGRRLASYEWSYTAPDGVTDHGYTRETAARQLLKRAQG